MKREDFVTTTYYYSKWWFIASFFFVGTCMFSLFSTSESALTSIDAKNQAILDSVASLCNGTTFIYDLEANEVNEIVIDSKNNDSQDPQAFIKYKGQDMGPKVCIKADETRGIKLTASELGIYDQLKGHIFSIISEDSKLIIQEWFSKNHVHDKGATNPRPFYIQGMFNDSHLDNREVNVENLVATERGIKYVIIDVSDLVLNPGKPLQFPLQLSIAQETFYLSNFWIKAHFATLISWLQISAYITFTTYKKFKRLSSKKSSKMSMMFLFLEIVDLVKDIIYFYTQDLSFVMIILFSQTLVIPFLFNIYSTKVVKLRYNGGEKYRDENGYDKLREAGEPREVNQCELLCNALKVHVGFQITEYENDYPQNRFYVQKYIKLMENIPQILLVLWDTFQKKKTITAMQVFNPWFALLMTIICLAEFVGYHLAAEYPYVHEADFMAIMPDGLNEIEKTMRRGIRGAIIEGAKTPEKW